MLYLIFYTLLSYRTTLIFNIYWVNLEYVGFLWPLVIIVEFTRKYHSFSSICFPKHGSKFRMKLNEFLREIVSYWKIIKWSRGSWVWSENVVHYNFTSDAGTKYKQLRTYVGLLLTLIFAKIIRLKKKNKRNWGRNYQKISYSKKKKLCNVTQKSHVSPHLIPQYTLKKLICQTSTMFNKSSYNKFRRLMETSVYCSGLKIVWMQLFLLIGARILFSTAWK